MKLTLSFTKNKKKYVSKEFDFEAMCLINDIVMNNTNEDGTAKHGILRICGGAVDYLFDGTDAPKLTPGTKARLCNELWSMYIEALTEKNEESGGDE